MKRLILASASPRRKEILSEYFDRFDILPADADESIAPGTPPEQAVRTLAARKARATYAHAGDPDAVVIGADTVVWAAGQILGKPHDRDHARQMLTLLQGTGHEVWSGVCVIANGQEYVGAECTRVHFVPMDAARIDRYVDCGECDDKAGAYAIQGKGGVFVERIDGSYQNVVGLPIITLDALLIQATGEGLL